MFSTRILNKTLRTTKSVKRAFNRLFSIFGLKELDLAAFSATRPSSNFTCWDSANAALEKIDRTADFTQPT